MAAPLNHEAQMHKASIVTIVAPALFAAAVMVSTGACARQIVTLSGTHSRGEVKKDCNASGGAYISFHDGSYSCYSQSGNGNVVDCNKSGKCTGSIPRQNKPPRTIGGILQPPSGVKTTGGDTTWTGGHHHPVKISGFKPPSGIKTTGGSDKPVTTTHAEEHHSGGAHK
jgi:hypothetical protein